MVKRLGLTLLTFGLALSFYIAPNASTVEASTDVTPDNTWCRDHAGCQPVFDFM